MSSADPLEVEVQPGSEFARLRDELDPIELAEGPGRYWCRFCEHPVTRGPSGTEYGHYRGIRDGTPSCPRRPDGVDPHKRGEY